VLSTKVCGPSGEMAWIRGGPERVDARHIRQAVEGSLRRLRVDAIDIFHVHWPDRYVPMFGEDLYDPSRRFVQAGAGKGGGGGGGRQSALSATKAQLEEQMAALGVLMREGKVRRVGLSNETPWGLMHCRRLSLQRDGQREQHQHQEKEEEEEPGRFFPEVSYVQNAYNLLCRSFDAGLSECCLEEGVHLLAYSPLAMGLLTGKYRHDFDNQHHPGEDPGDRDRGREAYRLNVYKGRYAEAEQRYERTPAVEAAVRRYCALAAEAGMRPVELALRFVLSHPCLGPDPTLTDIENNMATAATREGERKGAGVGVGARTVGQLDELAAAAAKGPLRDAGLLREIDAVHRDLPNPCV